MLKNAALALVLFAAAYTAPASGADASSWLQCGVIFGGKQLTYEGASEPKRKAQRLNAMLGTAQAEPLRFAPSAAAADADAVPNPAASNAPDKRLPARLTLATIGCSWR